MDEISPTNMLYWSRNAEKCPFPIPIGWFFVDYSENIKPGEHRMVHMLDQEWVFFRTEGGKPGLSDPFCPHLGAHIGQGGKVVGETIRCPFHHWGFSPEGWCKSIPYATEMPPITQRQPILRTLPLIDGFQKQFPAARLSIVEGLSTHIVEWITTGRVDLGLVYNPQADADLDITPWLKEPLCLVSKAPGRRRARSKPQPPLPMQELSGHRLIVPERAHAMRQLLETEAALAGIKLDIAWEVSSIPSIIDLVCAGYGHAVLTGSGVAASARAGELVVRGLVDPQPLSVLCLVSSSHRRTTPLVQRLVPVLEALVGAMPLWSPLA